MLYTGPGYLFTDSGQLFIPFSLLRTCRWLTVDPIQDDNIEDHFSDSNSESEEDGEENPDEDDDLGAEDGEGGFLDAEDEEGYAAL